MHSPGQETPTGAAVTNAQLSSLSDCAFGAVCSTIVVAARISLAPQFSTVPHTAADGWAPVTPVTVDPAAPPLPPPNA